MENRPEPGGPIAGATAALQAWLAAAGVRGSLTPPGDGPADPGTVRAWPVALRREQEVRNTSGPGPMRLWVRFLLAADGDADQVARQLDRLLVASLDLPAVQVAAEPVPAHLWRAFDVPPQLGLYADVETQAARARPAPAPRVRGPVQVDGAPLATVHGRVLGPGDVPIPGMRVVALDSNATAYTDNRGRFAFPALPADRPARLLVSGKGTELITEVAPSVDPVDIHCSLED